MANAIYPDWKEQVMQGTASASLGGTVKITMVTSAYIYSAAHTFRSSLSGEVGTAQTLANKTFTDGVFDNTVDPTWTSVAGGSTVNAFVIYIDNGSAATDRLVAYIDTDQTGLPFDTNGGDVTYTIDAAGIFTL